jgi:hypothetical protein
MLVPILGSILIILIAGIAPKRPVSLSRAVVCAVALVPIWLVAINVLAPLDVSLPTAGTARVAKFGTERLKEKEESLGEYVLIIEGSSPTSRAVDGDLLEAQLRSAGVSASVIQIALDGANHLERLQILREFVEGLSATDVEKLERSRVILCREVEFYYDCDPFNKIEEYAFTDRALDYLNLPNLPKIVRWFGLRFNSIGLLRKRKLLGAMATMEAFNLFRVGYLARLERGELVQSQNGFIPREVRSNTFHPSGPLPQALPGNPSRAELKIYHSLAAWVSVRDADYASVFGKIPVKQCFFSVTSWSDAMYRYNFWLAESSKDQPFFNGDVVPLRHSLADPDLWADEVHLRPAGARIFTLAFANWFIDAIRHDQI